MTELPGIYRGDVSYRRTECSEAEAVSPFSKDGKQHSEVSGIARNLLGQWRSGEK